jgi:hypothetical protein
MKNQMRNIVKGFQSQAFKNLRDVMMMLLFIGRMSAKTWQNQRTIRRTLKRN